MSMQPLRLADLEGGAIPGDTGDSDLHSDRITGSANGNVTRTPVDVTRCDRLDGAGGSIRAANSMLVSALAPPYASC